MCANFFLNVGIHKSFEHELMRLKVSVFMCVSIYLARLPI